MVLHSEIVGIHGNMNDGFCSAIAVCDVHVLAEDVLRLISCIMNDKRVDEKSMKCIKVVDGMDSCTVALLP